MLLFIIYWLLALALAFSFNLILGFYWYQHLLNKFNNFKNLSNSELFFFQDKYFNYLDISIWWFLLFSTFLIGIYSGWILEKKINILEKINLFWQKKQPEFYKRTKGEIRSLLPWLLISLPILITLIINILILVNFQLYTFLNLTISCLILGFIFGQLIVSITMYKETINLDRPFKEAEAPIKKIVPNLSKEISLLIGQIYCRILIPFIFTSILLYILTWIIIIPKINNYSFKIIIFSILIGLITRWFYDGNKKLYFDKISIRNLFFISVKINVSIIILFGTLIYLPKIYLLIISILVGFFISWQPKKLV